MANDLLLQLLAGIFTGVIFGVRNLDISRFPLLDTICLDF